MTKMLENAIEYWKYIAPIAKRPETEQDYDALVAHMDKLLDIVGDDECHPLTGLVDIISDYVSDYETEHYKEPLGSGIDALKYLMDVHHLTQTDLKNEIGSQGVVSEILNGYRKLNVKHIEKLAERFRVSPATFIG
jgi:HTH-type transcriptional regulator/antitoxin HigA